MNSSQIEKATLGGGCFWCIEAVFLELEGVVKVESGYSGGHVDNPSYEAVCNGTTGHAEVVQVSFDSSIVSYQEIIEIFFFVHDPTTLNRQGNDVGTQYRSVIYFHDENQKKIANKVIEYLTENNVYDNKIVTEISPLETFYKAEEYHQNYYARNTNQGYCTFVITPKVNKFRQKYLARLKSN